MIIYFILASYLHNFASCQIMAIDYGSSSYKVALVKVGTPMEILLNRESKRYTPPCIGFKDGVRHIGSGALNILKKGPESAFCNFHTLLGRTFDHEAVSDYIFKNPLINIKKHEVKLSPVFYPKGYDLNFTPEEFIAQIMNESSTIADGVRTFVIAMPPLIDHSIRNSIKIASRMIKASMVGIIDTSTAASYQYLINKRSELLAGSSSVLMIYDLGASTSTATIISSYSESLVGGKQARADVLGIGFVPVGGDHITDCVYELLLKKLKAVYPSYTELIKNHRKMMALKNEAEKIKVALSSAPLTTFHIEYLYENNDFSGKITREQIEESCAKHFEEVSSSIEMAFKSANLSKKDIKSLILMGKASRTYCLYPYIQRKSGIEKLSGILNTEDSIAIGASFKGADISKQFKVAKLSVHPGVVYPYVMIYEKLEMDESTNEQKIKEYSRVLYPHMSSTSQKRTVTIYNITSNLTILVRYGDLPEFYAKSSFLKHDTDLLNVLIYGLEDAIKMNPMGIFKSMKVTFGIDHFGMIEVTKCEAKFEKIPEKSALSKVMDSISSVFGFGSNETDPVQNSTSQSEIKDEKSKETLNNSSETSDINKTITDSNRTAINSSETLKEKPIPFYEILSLKIKVKTLYFQAATDEEIAASFIKLRKIKLKELKKEAEAKAKSDLESYLLNTKERLFPGQDYHGVLSPEELVNLTGSLEEISLWFEQNGYQDDFDTNTKKQNILITAFSIADLRLAEIKELESELKNFYHIANLSISMITEAVKMPGAMDVLNDSYLQNLTQLVNKTVEKTRLLEDKQKSVKPFETAILTSESVKESTSMLHSSISAMISEVKKSSYKKKPTTSSESSQKNNSTNFYERNDSRKTGVDDEIPQSNDTKSNITDEKTIEHPPLNEEDIKSENLDQNGEPVKKTSTGDDTDFKSEL